MALILLPLEAPVTIMVFLAIIFLFRLSVCEIKSRVLVKYVIPLSGGMIRTIRCLCGNRGDPMLESISELSEAQ